MKYLVNRSIAELKGIVKKPSVRQGIVALVLVCVGLTMAAGATPEQVKASNDNASGMAARFQVKPQLTATLIMPTQIGFCKNFNFHITVMNYGNAPANNAHLFFKQYPGGFFSLVNIDRASSRINQHIEDIALDNLKANEQRDINFVISVPLQKKLNADWTRKFYFNFTVSYDYVPEEPLGNILFLAGNSKIVVQRSSFTQK
jgi:hypothetical protein